jgi:hypothetical protein
MGVPLALFDSESMERMDSHLAATVGKHVVAVVAAGRK